MNTSVEDQVIYEDYFQEGNNTQNVSSYRTIYQVHEIVSFTTHVVLITIGSFVNLWMLISIVLSSEMRKRMRNKVICNILIVNLMETMVLSPLYIVCFLRFMRRKFGYDSYLSTFFTTVLQYAQFCAINWLLVVLVSVFLAQVMYFKPKLTPTWNRILTILTLTFPWILTLLVVSIAMHYFRYYSLCMNAVYSLWYRIPFIDTLIPQVLTILLLIVAAILKRKRYPQGQSCDNIHFHLLSHEVDPTLALVGSVAISVLSDIVIVFAVLDLIVLPEIDHHTWMTLAIIFTLLSMSYAITMPFVFLLFPDIRQRIKSWKPWRRVPPSTDFLISYQSNNSEIQVHD